MKSNKNESVVSNMLQALVVRLTDETVNKLSALEISRTLDEIQFQIGAEIVAEIDSAAWDWINAVPESIEGLIHTGAKAAVIGKGDPRFSKGALNPQDSAAASAGERKGYSLIRRAEKGYRPMHNACSAPSALVANMDKMNDGTRKEFQAAKDRQEFLTKAAALEWQEAEISFLD